MLSRKFQRYRRPRTSRPLALPPLLIQVDDVMITSRPKTSRPQSSPAMLQKGSHHPSLQRPRSRRCSPSPSRRQSPIDWEQEQVQAARRRVARLNQACEQRQQQWQAYVLRMEWKRQLLKLIGSLD